MNIKYLDPQELKPYPGNAKVHSPEQIAALKRTIKKLGFDQPIVVDTAMVIIKGHGRRQAAIELGLPEVPVIVASHLTPAQVRMSRLVDNDIVSGDWDITMLSDDLTTLKNMGGDLAEACVSEDEFQDLISLAQGHSIEVSDHLIHKINVKETCPKCKYRF